MYTSIMKKIKKSSCKKSGTGHCTMHARLIRLFFVIYFYNTLNSISTDPFYSESNMAHLRRGIGALNAGKGVEHELIHADE